MMRRGISCKYQILSSASLPGKSKFPTYIDNDRQDELDISYNEAGFPGCRARWMVGSLLSLLLPFLKLKWANKLERIQGILAN